MLLSVLESLDKQESQELRCQESELQESRGMPESLDEWESQKLRCQESELQESRGMPESLDERELQVQCQVGGTEHWNRPIWWQWWCPWDDAFILIIICVTGQDLHYNDICEKVHSYCASALLLFHEPKSSFSIWANIVGVHVHA